jgi:hypothetical protein
VTDKDNARERTDRGKIDKIFEQGTSEQLVIVQLGGKTGE